MKKLLYVSLNTRKLYKQLISLRGTEKFTELQLNPLLLRDFIYA